MSDSRYAVRILRASVQFRDWPLATPLQLSTGVITAATAAEVRVEVRAGDRIATGNGAMFLSEQWAWPVSSLSRPQRAKRLRMMSQRIAERLPQLVGDEAAHPLELGMRLHDQAAAGADDDEAGASEPAPRLARLLAASPFDAAIHDAAGRLFERSAFQLYDEPSAAPSVDAWFPDGGAIAAVKRILRTAPVREFPATFVVGPGDDGIALVRLLSHWMVRRHYARVKLKLMGRDPEQDARRAAGIARAMDAGGAPRAWMCVDFNGAYPDADSLRTFLEEWRRDHPETYADLQYLEQPTSADSRGGEVDWRSGPPDKPVLLDEGLVGMEAFAEALERGWSGAALKTCKGLSFMLAAAAWATPRGALLTLQDLTNPGRAAVQAAWFGAFVPTFNGLELNAAQFVPEANADWVSAYPGLLDVRDGWHRLPESAPIGLQ